MVNRELRETKLPNIIPAAAPMGAEKIQRVPSKPTARPESDSKNFISLEPKASSENRGMVAPIITTPMTIHRMAQWRFVVEWH